MVYFFIEFDIMAEVKCDLELFAECLQERRPKFTFGVCWKDCWEIWPEPSTSHFNVRGLQSPTVSREY